MTRQEWAQNVMMEMPEFADTLKMFRELFRAKVMVMEAEKESCCWREEQMIPDNMTLVIPSTPWSDDRKYDSGFKMVSKKRNKM